MLLINELPEGALSDEELEGINAHLGVQGVGVRQVSGVEDQWVSAIVLDTCVGHGETVWIMGIRSSQLDAEAAAVMFLRGILEVRSNTLEALPSVADPAVKDVFAAVEEFGLAYMKASASNRK